MKASMRLWLLVLLVAMVAHTAGAQSSAADGEAAPAAAVAVERGETSSSSSEQAVEEDGPGGHSVAPSAAVAVKRPLQVTLQRASVVPALPRLTDEAYRDLRLSAFTLPGKTFSFNTRLLGIATNETIASLGLDYGLGKGVQVGVNVAHLGVGLLNLSGKWTFFEKGSWAVAAEFSPVYVHGDWVWLARMQELFAGVDLVTLPAQLVGSFHIVPWLQVDLTARYTGGLIVGDVATRNINLDADITAHEFALLPALRAHLMGRTTLMVAAALPLYRAVPATTDLAVELAPGVVAGGSLNGTRTRSLDQTYRIEIGLRSMVSRRVFLEFGLNFGAQTELLYGSPVFPRMGVEVRF